MNSPVTLVVGATPNPERYSFLATALLEEKGYSVYPFGIKKGFIHSTEIISIWPAQNSIDTVTLYIGPAAQNDYLEAIIHLAPRRIIFNPGTENPILASLAAKAGIETLEACTLVMLKTGQY